MAYICSTIARDRSRRPTSRLNFWITWRPMPGWCGGRPPRYVRGGPNERLPCAGLARGQLPTTSWSLIRAATPGRPGLNFHHRITPITFQRNIRGPVPEGSKRFLKPIELLQHTGRKHDDVHAIDDCWSHWHQGPYGVGRTDRTVAHIQLEAGRGRNPA